MALPQKEMTAQDICTIWKEWNVPCAERIKFQVPDERSKGKMKFLKHATDIVPTTPDSVELVCRGQGGSVLTALVAAFRRQGAEVETIFSGQDWAPPPEWNPGKIQQEYDRKME